MHANVNGTFNVLEAARILEVPQVLFASSIGTYGLGMTGEHIDDLTLQRPLSFYGTAKLFGEGAGNFYRHRYGLDFRGIRFPGICGPGVRTPGAAQFHSWVIEECAKGRPYTIEVAPHTRVPIVYVKDAARGVLQLSRAPRDRLQQFNYLINGVPPTPSAEQLADAGSRPACRARASTFEVDAKRQAFIDRLMKPVDDRFAREEWGWNPGLSTRAPCWTTSWPIWPPIRSGIRTEPVSGCALFWGALPAVQGRASFAAEAAPTDHGGRHAGCRSAFRRECFVDADRNGRRSASAPRPFVVFCGARTGFIRG